MLGPSGSGKTTLLTALAGRLPSKVLGIITYNGLPFSSSMKCKTSFVAQDDVLYPHLTVLEALTYAALLRLPKKLTEQEKIEQAEMVIVELGLTRYRNNIIGGPLLRGVSGGERKRVSIGQEMLVNPSLLLLDEPTSSLDSTTAQHIISFLRGLARKIFHPLDSHHANVNGQMKFMPIENIIHHDPSNYQFPTNLIRPSFHHPSTGVAGLDPSSRNPLLQ